LVTSRVPGVALRIVSVRAARAFQGVEVLAGQADGDRGVDRRAVLEGDDADPRPGEAVEVAAQAVQHLLALARLPGLQADEHLGDRWSALSRWVRL
jgi:hypothetical protein